MKDRVFKMIWHIDNITECTDAGYLTVKFSTKVLYKVGHMPHPLLLSFPRVLLLLSYMLYVLCLQSAGCLHIKVQCTQSSG